ncbi:YafY family transcriptional regulator [Ornithinimicrobium sp. F0845]|uniref:helix-turn-helix transcriptional regulator n=1 Tax=Ornithinimicrobium sp. F0845 TaxID=2926412 RepID=UPI001FF56C0F|nr:YafY family protein [Ornithinimicrobium sp. F0845]MCK0112846.1 YafY family transcriptional regulator [Ornithinimicrobium sp. F0845]
MPTPAGRLLTLLSLLQARRDWSGSDLAGRLEVSARTVRRDVDRLREMGYPVQTTKGPDGGYRLAPGSDLPPMLFDDDQAVAVAVALQTAAGSIGGIEEASLRALTTIRQVMPSRLRHRVDALQVTAVGSSAGPPPVDAQRLLAVGTACRDHEVLRFGYTAKDGVESVRRVEPHRLVSWGRRWYLVAWDLERDDWRTFRVDRLTPRVPTGPRFTPRELTDERVAELVRPPESASPWQVRGTVLMRAPASLVTQWVPPYQGSVTAVDEESCLVDVGSWSYPSLAGWLLLFEADFEVISPPELRSALDDTAARLARAVAASAEKPARP